MGSDVSVDAVHTQVIALLTQMLFPELSLFCRSIIIHDPYIIHAVTFIVMSNDIGS